MKSALQISSLVLTFGKSSREVPNTLNIEKVEVSKFHLSEGIRATGSPSFFLVINSPFPGIPHFLYRIKASILVQTKNFYPMKKVIVLISAAVMLQSCATVLNGKRTECQKLQKKNEVNRQINMGWVAVDILCGIIPLFIDFKTGALYEKEAPDCKPKK